MREFSTCLCVCRVPLCICYNTKAAISYFALIPSALFPYCIKYNTLAAGWKHMLSWRICFMEQCSVFQVVLCSKPEMGTKQKCEGFWLLVHQRGNSTRRMAYYLLQFGKLASLVPLKLRKNWETGENVRLNFSSLTLGNSDQIPGKNCRYRKKCYMIDLPIRIIRLVSCRRNSAFPRVSRTAATLQNP